MGRQNYVTRANDGKKFTRNDLVVVFGKTWRIDHIDGSWLIITNDDNEIKNVSVNAVEHVADVERERAIEDILSLD